MPPLDSDSSSFGHNARPAGSRRFSVAIVESSIRRLDFPFHSRASSIITSRTTLSGSPTSYQKRLQLPLDLVGGIKVGCPLPDSANSKATLIDMSNGKLDKDSPGLKKCEFMLQQFNLEILVSTFSCGLILSFCGFINGVLARQHNQPYQPLFEMGVLTSFIAIVFHIWNIFLAKRGASLCSKHIELKPSPMDHPVEQGLECLMWSKRLFSWGIYLFSVSVSVMAVLMFDDAPYMTVFLSVYCFAAAHLLFGQYRNVSALCSKIIFIDRTLFELMAWLEKLWSRYRTR